MNGRAATDLYRVEASVSAINDSKGQPLGYRGIFMDVTERKEAEILSRENMAAEAANRSKGEFLVDMRHEIRAIKRHNRPG